MADEEPREVEEILNKLTDARLYRFPARGERLEAPDKRGVYIIYSPESESKVLHVGSTPRAQNGLFGRLSDHLNGRSSFTYMQFGGDGSHLRSGYRYRYLVVNDARKRALVEALGIGRLCPKHIGSGLN